MDVQQLQRLLQYYVEILKQTYQYEVAGQIRTLATERTIVERFVKIVPKTSAPVPTSAEVLMEDMAE